MQNFLINPYSHIVANLLYQRNILSSDSPIHVVVDIGEELTVGIEPTNIIGLLTEMVVNAVLDERKDIPHIMYPTRPNLFPDFQLDDGFLEIKATNNNYIKLCAFQTFANRMIESEDMANLAFFTDFLVMEYDTNENGTYFSRVVIKKIWQLADQGNDEGLVVHNGSIISHDDVFANGASCFNDEYGFLRAASITAEQVCGFERDEWYQQAEMFIAPYTNE